MSLFYFNAITSIVGMPYYKHIVHDEWNKQKVYDDLMATYQLDNQTRPRWFQREVEQEPVPPKKRTELEKCQNIQLDIWDSTILYAIYLESVWWIERNVKEYIQHRRFICPKWDKDSLESLLAWKLYFLELKQRILVPWIKYQATLMFVHRFQRFLENRLSHETMLRLNQHPYQRAMAIVERESDLLQRGFDVVVANLWGNVIILMASYTVDQIGVLYGYTHNRVLAQSRQVQNPEQDEEDLVVLVNTSWNLLVVNTRRLLYSAAGAGLGCITFLDPVWATLLGLKIGDDFARRQMPSEIPTPVLTIILNCISDLVGMLR